MQLKQTNCAMYDIAPVSKPRMTRADKWKKRDCVVKYRAYKDEVRGQKVQLPDSGAWIIFVLAMPVGWSKKKKKACYGKPHQQRPDKDNLEKGLLDALFEEDSRVWDGRTSKIWGYTGSIIIKDCPINIEEIKSLLVEES